MHCLSCLNVHVHVYIYAHVTAHDHAHDNVFVHVHGHLTCSLVRIEHSAIGTWGRGREGKGPLWERPRPAPCDTPCALETPSCACSKPPSSSRTVPSHIADACGVWSKRADTDRPLCGLHKAPSRCRARSSRSLQLSPPRTRNERNTRSDPCDPDHKSARSPRDPEHEAHDPCDCRHTLPSIIILNKGRVRSQRGLRSPPPLILALVL